MSNRYRDIVKLAATQDPESAAIEWLMRDEFGKWEARAKELVEQVSDKAKTFGLSDAELDEQCATYLRLLAIEGMLSSAAKKGQK